MAVERFTPPEFSRALAKLEKPLSTAAVLEYHRLVCKQYWDNIEEALKDVMHDYAVEALRDELWGVEYDGAEFEAAASAMADLCSGSALMKMRAMAATFADDMRGGGDD